MTPNPEQGGEVVLELIDVDVPSQLDPERLALAGVSWRVARGEFWVIGGLQGTGKSELLCAAASLYRPVRGVCRLFGRDIPPTYADECLAERLRVGLVFGSGGRLFNALTLRENVALPLDYHQVLGVAESQARVAALLEATGLTEWADLLPSSVKPSWRQRVALARALAVRPEILLLDNPLAGLDPSHTRWWMGFLDQLCSGHPLLDNRPATVVVAGNDLRPWLDPAHRFALLDGARFVPLQGLPDARLPEASATLCELLAVPSRSL